MTWKKGSKSSVPAWFVDAMDEWCEDNVYELGWDLFVNNTKPGYWVVVYDSYDGAKFVRYSGFPMGVKQPHGSDMGYISSAKMLKMDAENFDVGGPINPSHLYVYVLPENPFGFLVKETNPYAKACMSLARFAQKLISDPRGFPWWRKTGQADKEYEKGGA